MQKVMNFTTNGRDRVQITKEKHNYSNKKSVSISNEIGQNLRAFAMLMVASSIRMSSMLLVRWMVILFVGCDSFSTVLASASTILPVLVFVFPHKILARFGYFVIRLFDYLVAHIFPLAIQKFFV